MYLTYKKDIIELIYFNILEYLKNIQEKINKKIHGNINNKMTNIKVIHNHNKYYINII